jgi:hypothetical protein
MAHGDNYTGRKRPRYTKHANMSVAAHERFPFADGLGANAQLAIRDSFSAGAPARAGTAGRIA